MKGMRKLEQGELTEVGDILEYTDLWGRTIRYEVTRVTKTLTVCKIPRAGGMKRCVELKYKREIQFNMSYPHERWFTKEITVWRKEDA